MKRIYKCSKGASFGEEKAQVYGQELYRLTRRKKGRLKPVDIVDDAKSEASPLHGYFEWNNIFAGQNWRLQQARQLVNHIEIEIVRPDTNETQSIKAFYSYIEEIPNDGKEQFYVTAETVARDEVIKKVLLEKAMAEIITWKKRYAELGDLGEIFGIIEKTQKREEKIKKPKEEKGEPQKAKP